MQTMKSVQLALFVTAAVLTGACSRREEAPPPAVPDLTTSPIPSAPAITPAPASDVAPAPLPSSSAVMDSASAASAASMPN